MALIRSNITFFDMKFYIRLARLIVLNTAETERDKLSADMGEMAKMRAMSDTQQIGRIGTRSLSLVTRYFCLTLVKIGNSGYPK